MAALAMHVPRSTSEFAADKVRAGRLAVGNGSPALGKFAKPEANADSREREK